MSDYTVRVELHGATAEDYENLHNAMEKAGFYRAFVASDGDTYELPTAEYAHFSAITSAFEVRDQVMRIADSLKTWARLPWVLVTKADGDRAIRSYQIK